MKNNRFLKAVSAVLCLLFLGSLLPAGYTRAESVSGDFEYRLVPNMTAEILSFAPGAILYEIPTELDGYPVSAIGPRAFENAQVNFDLVIPEGITRIGDSAFCNAEELYTVSLPASLEYVGHNPFEEIFLYQFKLSPDNTALEVRDGMLFSKADNRLIACPDPDGDEITVPAGTKLIDNGAFHACSQVSKITLPDGVLRIGDGAFRGCDCLDTVNIPDSVTYIGDYAFYDCSRLESLTIPDSVTHIGASAFSGCSNCEGLALPAHLTELGDYAFYLCGELRSVSVPDSLLYVGSNPFAACFYLYEITASLDHPALEVIDNVLFSRADKRLVCYPSGLDAEEYAVPDGTAVIGELAFSDSEYIGSILLPDSVTEVQQGAFFVSSPCTVTMPASVLLIDEDAFITFPPYIFIDPAPGSYAESYALRRGLLKTETSVAYFSRGAYIYG